MLLSRDRNFLAQSLLIPVVIIASQLLVSGQLSSITLLGQNQQLMAVIAFGIGSYVLLLSAFQAINTEGNALWMLYTFPRRIDSMLREKAQLWTALAALYPLLIFAAGLYFTPDFNWRLLWWFVVVMAGIPIYALIAVSLGVFASDPHAQETQARVRPTYAYLYMMLSSLYIFALYATSWLQTVAIMILTASLALALWQKARDELPYLLDPAAAPPARVALSDGLIAATLFFVLQLLVGLMLRGGSGSGGNLATGVIAFVCAGAIVYLLMRYLYWRHKTAGVPAVLNTQHHGGAAAAAPQALITRLRLRCRLYVAAARHAVVAAPRAAGRHAARTAAADSAGRAVVRGIHLQGIDFRRPAPAGGGASRCGRQRAAVRHRAPAAGDGAGTGAGIVRRVGL
jgi:hypothetical protein